MGGALPTFLLLPWLPLVCRNRACRPNRTADSWSQQLAAAHWYAVGTTMTAARASVRVERGTVDPHFIRC